MKKVTDMLGQEISKHAAKSASDLVSSQKSGVKAYNTFGVILTLCGVGWMLLSIIPYLCNTPIGDWVWMPILGGLQLVIGIMVVVLVRKSKRFQEWSEKDFRKSLKEQADLTEKAVVRGRRMPFTNGDILALKICLVVFVVFVVFIAIMS